MRVIVYALLIIVAIACLGAATGEIGAEDIADAVFGAIIAIPLMIGVGYGMFRGLIAFIVWLVGA
jgi:hypothetical protein